MGFFRLRSISFRVPHQEQRPGSFISHQVRELHLFECDALNTKFRACPWREKEAIISRKHCWKHLDFEVPSLLHRAMATTSKIALSADSGGIFHTPCLTEESAAKASALLQENHERHHIYFNTYGFHDHIVHHILSAFACGATPDQLQCNYDENLSYQWSKIPINHENVKDMHDPKKFAEFLGEDDRFSDFLEFFKGEIDRKGADAVFQEYLMKGDDLANDLLVRSHTGMCTDV